MSSWAIVGGGMLGSTLAIDLADAGEDVTLYERALSLGGLASAWNIGDVTWDRHYHVTLLSDQNTRRILQRLGLEEDMRWVETRTGTWVNDELHSMSSTFDYIRYPALSLIDKARLARTILSANRIDDWRPLEKVTVESWLREKSGDRVFERFWLPLLRAKLGDSYRDTSAAYLWATIRRLYAARSQGLKKEMFGYVPGGYSRILSVFEATLVEAGVRLRLGADVTGVQSGPTVTSDGETSSYDGVVVTTAPPVTARLVPALETAELEVLQNISYQGIVCASVLVSKPLDGYYLTYLYNEVPFTGIIEMSSFVDPVEFGGRTLIYLPKYCPPDDPLFERSDEEIAEQFLPALEEVYPTFDRRTVEAFKVSRVRNVFPVPTLGYSERIPEIDTSIDGVHLVSSAQIVNSTLNVNDTVALATNAFVHLMGDRLKASV